MTALPSNITPDIVKEKVEGFYIRDDISRQAPGKKDFVMILKLDGEVQSQKGHLLLQHHRDFWNVQGRAPRSQIRKINVC